MPKRLTETTPLGENTTASTSGRMRIHAITAGLGSSGYYSTDVLERAATNELITAGTPLFLDHASESERRDRPERSVKEIAAVFVTPATYDADEEALVGEIQVFSPWRDALTEMAPYIGLSISGSATDIALGEVDGKQVPVVEDLAAIDSVDFVTRAGRGGKVVELLESARVNERARAHGVSEATVNDQREALNTLVKDAYGAEKVWPWVRDFDETTVWFEIESPDDYAVFAQAYDTNDDGLPTSLTGDRTEVRATTTYVPVNPAGQSTTQESQEDTMPQIEESELARLREAAGRVTTLETERDAAVRERDAAGRALAVERATSAGRARAAARVREANGDLHSAVVERIVNESTRDVPLTEAGALDEAALDKRVDEARTREETYLAQLAEASGAGKVRGLGTTEPKDKGDVTEADADAAIAAAFGRTQVKEA